MDSARRTAVRPCPHGDSPGGVRRWRRRRRRPRRRRAGGGFGSRGERFRGGDAGRVPGDAPSGDLPSGGPFWEPGYSGGESTALGLRLSLPRRTSLRGSSLRRLRLGVPPRSHRNADAAEWSVGCEARLRLRLRGGPGRDLGIPAPDRGRGKSPGLAGREGGPGAGGDGDRGGLSRRDERISLSRFRHGAMGGTSLPGVRPAPPVILCVVAQKSCSAPRAPLRRDGKAHRRGIAH